MERRAMTRSTTKARMTSGQCTFALLDAHHLGDPLRAAVETEARRLGLDALAADRAFTGLCGLLAREAEAAEDRRLRARLRGAA